MYIKTIKQVKVGKDGKKYNGNLLLLKCDNCKEKFERRYIKEFITREHHFCSVRCSSNSEYKKNKIEKTCQEKYGYKNNFMAKDENGNVKRSQTKKEKYGSEGYNNLRQTSQTKKEKYGSEKYNNSEQIKQTKEERLKENINYYNETTVKMKQTKKERYGSESYVNPEKAKRTKKDKYGDENYCNVEQIHLSKKKNGSYGKSEEENRYYKYLLTLHDKEDIVRQKKVRTWEIDFYIVSEDLYVEYYGDFVHGRNKTKSELLNKAIICEKRTGKKSRYRGVIKAIESDIEKKQYFEDNGLKLKVVWGSDFKRQTGE